MNNSRSMLAFAFSILIQFALQNSLHAQQVVSFRGTQPRYAGVSDEFLVHLGTGAESFLFDRLNIEKNPSYQRGLILRLQYIDGLDTENRNVFYFLRRWVESRVQRPEDCTESGLAFYHALETIGMKGGDHAVDYLAEWLTTETHSSKIRCHRRPENGIFRTKYVLFEGAILGLGWNSSPRALEVLKSIHDNPPQDVNHDGLLSLVRLSLDRNQKIRELGWRRAYPYLFDYPNDAFKRLRSARK